MPPETDPAVTERETWRARVGDSDGVERAARALIAGDMGPIADSLNLSGIGRPTIQIDPPEASLDHAPLIALHRFWSARRGTDGAPPLAAAIDPADLRATLGHVHWLQTDATGFDYVFWFYGDAVAAHSTRDWTGWSIGALTLKVSNGLGLYFRALQAACALSRRPIASQHASPPLLRAAAWRRLTVPLLDGMGACTQFLAATVPIAFQYRAAEEEAEIRRRLAAGEPE